MVGVGDVYMFNVILELNFGFIIGIVFDSESGIILVGVVV